MTLSAVVRSPCIGICQLDQQRQCTACYRSVDEIAQWRQMSEQRKREVLLKIEQRRQD